MSRSTRSLLLVLPALCFASSAAHATVLTLPSQLSSSNTVIDFESFSAGPTSNPLTIGAAKFSSTSPLAIEDISSYGANGTTVTHNILRSNGGLPLGNGGYTPIRIDFSVPVGEVGMGWFDPNLPGNVLEVYDSSNNLLESAPIPTGPTGGGFAGFGGIHRASNDIAYALTQCLSNDIYGIDNVSYGRVSVKDVPEPSAWMVALGAVPAALLLRRRRK